MYEGPMNQIQNLPSSSAQDYSADDLATFLGLEYMSIRDSLSEDAVRFGNLDAMTYASLGMDPRHTSLAQRVFVVNHLLLGIWDHPFKAAASFMREPEPMNAQEESLVRKWYGEFLEFDLVEEVPLGNGLTCVLLKKPMDARDRLALGWYLRSLD